MLTCFFVASTLFITDGVDAMPIGPQTYIQHTDNELVITVGSKTTTYYLTQELSDTGLDGIIGGCNVVAMEDYAQTLENVASGKASTPEKPL